MILKTQNNQETQAFGKKFAKKLKGGEILALVGELGSGKTVFVKGVAKGLGIKETITSPTFVLLRQYSVPLILRSSDTLSLIHLDLYRLKNNEIDSLGLSDYLGKKEYICVIEWAEKIKNKLKRFGNKVVWIKFEYIDENMRKINIKFQSSNVK